MAEHNVNLFSLLSPSCGLHPHTAFNVEGQGAVWTSAITTVMATNTTDTTLSKIMLAPFPLNPNTLFVQYGYISVEVHCYALTKPIVQGPFNILSIQIK